MFTLRLTCVAAMLANFALSCPADETRYASHPPMRSLPAAAARPLPDGPVYFVDANRGDDDNPGNKDKPWQTIAHALTKLKPGDTLALRGGVYYEPVHIAIAGEPDKPITIRAHPDELVIIDAGLREFVDDPKSAWRVNEHEDAAPGEYISTLAYPGLEKVFGNFGDSMVPLHGYKNRNDLRSANEYWNGGGKLDTDWSIYCGPGVWYDQRTGRIHCRLAHTTLPQLGPDNYRGETDPRRLSLVITAAPNAVHIRIAQHVRLQDLVLRGARRSALSIEHSAGIEIDNVTCYGSDPAVNLRGCRDVRLLRCNIRGISAPWSFRAGHKYRGTAAYLLIARADDAANRDIEIAHCELTDSHDGPFIGTIRGLKLHHNLIDNFNDDGVYLTAMSLGGDVHIYQNYISRCLHAFSFFGEYPVGAGVWIYRNVIDLRAPVHYGIPSGPADERFTPRGEGERHRFYFAGRLCGDHGGPVWEPIRFYHNTVVSRDAAFRNYYGLGWGGHLNHTQRWVYNNIFVQLEAWPGLNVVPKGYEGFHAGGNLHFGVAGEAPSAKARADAATGDVLTDPRLSDLHADWRKPLMPHLRAGSPAIDAGVAIPGDWPDPLRGADKAAPDIGALPAAPPAGAIGPHRPSDR